jgi:hypothetical protein
MPREFFLPLLLLALLAGTACATEGDSLWSQSYGGGNCDEAHSMILSSDGCLLLVGGTGPFGAGSMDMWLVKVNTQGNCLWSQTYGGSYLDDAFSLIPAGDDGFLLAGWTSSSWAGAEDMCLLKVDAGGDFLWSRTYGGDEMEWAHSIIPSDDGGFLLVGLTESFGAGDDDMWLVKVNAQGDPLWSHT